MPDSTPRLLPTGRVLWQSLLLRVIERPDGVLLALPGGSVTLTREQAAELGERLSGRRGRRVGPTETKGA